MIKEVEFDPAPFVQCWLNRPLVPIGDKEQYQRELEEKFGEYPRYHSDPFLLECLKNFEELGYRKFDSIDAFRPRCFDIHGKGQIEFGLRLSIAGQTTPHIQTNLGLSDEDFFQHFDEIRQLCKTHFQRTGALYWDTVFRSDVAVPFPHEVGMHTVAGRYRKALPNKPTWRIEKARAPMDYDDYKGQYIECMQGRPEIGGRVGPTNPKRLQKAFDDGLYYFFYVDGEQAGFLCAEDTFLCGNKAAYMIDIFLFTDFRGKGLASVMQQHFHQTIDPSYKFIWGTIENVNQPSLKTALSCGRSSVGKEVEFPL